MKNHTLASLGMLVVLMVLALAAPAMADGKGNILRVGPGQEYDYENIQAAVDAARQGSRILVYPRIGSDIEEYVESVMITTNNLQIIAQGSSDVTVNPPEGKPGFDVNADHVTVRGFDISGALCANGILFQGSHNTFAENKIHGFAGPCDTALIRCHDEDGGSDYNTIESNHLSGWGIASGSFGIYVVAAGSDALNEGNVIKNNTIVSLQGPGIYVSNGTGFQISGNYLENTFFHEGISIEARNNAYQGNHRILKNTIWYPSAAGISLHALPGTVLAHNHISDNKIMESGADCIALTADEGAALVYNRVSSNEVVGSIGLNGIHLFADQGAAVNDNLILDNTVSGNHEDGILLSAGSDHNRILNNEVVANVKVGIFIAGDNNLIVGNDMWKNGEIGRKDLGEGNRWRNNTVIELN
jgi:parallel beta-helix repeat protein